MNKNFCAIILSGGSGERFWPLSTPERPKQFLDIFGGKSLLRQSFERLLGLASPEQIIVITGKSLVNATRRELPELPRSNIIGEPCRRDTAAAMASALAISSRRFGPDAVTAVVTADHLIADRKKFCKTLNDCVKTARKTDSIVTIGIKPSYPATGFGYIRPSSLFNPASTGTCFHKVSSFTEKPPLPVAKKYLKQGCLWNSGMFIWRVDTMKQAFASCAPGFMPLIAALEKSPSPERTMAKLYEKLPKISIDYAVIEKYGSIIAATGDFGWDDVGSWPAVADHFAHDSGDNTLKGPVATLDTSSSIIVSDSPAVKVIGMKGVIVAATKNGVVVMPADRAQDIKKLALS